MMQKSTVSCICVQHTVLLHEGSINLCHLTAESGLRPASGYYFLYVFLNRFNLMPTTIMRGKACKGIYGSSNRHFSSVNAPVVLIISVCASWNRNRTVKTLSSLQNHVPPPRNMKNGEEKVAVRRMSELVSCTNTFVAHVRVHFIISWVEEHLKLCV